jgi:FliI/YscN family ATPase
MTTRIVVRARRVVGLEEDGERRVLGIPLLGRAIDGMGQALDGRPPPQGRRAPRLRAPLPSERVPLRVPMWTGIRAIDGVLTLVRGMRIGIFGPPGSGKSRLLEAIARGIDADAVVIALVGERGNEAHARIAACDSRTTVICAPSDRSAGERLAAGELALVQALALKDHGLDVAVVFDSLARYVDAARQIALAGGEMPGRGGYPPSVWPRLAALCERAGATARGSITLVATVLSDAADAADPLAEAARSYLDGHIVLSRRRAERGAFPAIDVPASLSRSMPAAVDERHQGAAARVRAALARLEDSREARELGFRPDEPDLARAVAAEPGLEAFLCQGPEAVSAAETLGHLFRIADTV